MKKKQIILISILVCSLLLSSILTIQANALPEQAGGLIIINQLLTEIQSKLDTINQHITWLLEGQEVLNQQLSALEDMITIIYGTASDVAQIKTHTNKISGIDTKIDEVSTKVWHVQLDLDELNIKIPANIPILHKEEFELSPNNVGNFLLISCNKPYELKAVYIYYFDPDEQVSIREVGQCWVAMPKLYTVDTNFYPIEVTEDRFELLERVGLHNNPTCGAADKVRFYFQLEGAEFIDGDETMTVKVLVSAPYDASISAMIT